MYAAYLYLHLIENCIWSHSAITYPVSFNHNLYPNWGIPSSDGIPNGVADLKETLYWPGILGTASYR